MEKVTNYNISTFIERISNGKYTSLYKDNVFVGGITINNKNDINEFNYSINCAGSCLYITINHNHNIISVMFDSFEN